MMLGIFWGRTVMTPTSGAGGGAGGASLEQPARALQAAATAQANLLSKIFHRCILEVPIAQARPSLQNVGRGPSVTSITSQRPKRVRPETGLGDIGEKITYAQTGAKEAVGRASCEPPTRSPKSHSGQKEVGEGS